MAADQQIDPYASSDIDPHASSGIDPYADESDPYAGLPRRGGPSI